MFKKNLNTLVNKKKNSNRYNWAWLRGITISNLI